MWTFRWEARLVWNSHWSHLNGFSPLWIILCFFRLPLSFEAYSHSLHFCDFTWLCTFMCWFNAFFHGVEYSHCGHFFNLLHQLQRAIDAIPNSAQSWYEEIIFTFGPCDDSYEVRSCSRLLWHHRGIFVKVLFGCEKLKLKNKKSGVGLKTF